MLKDQDFPISLEIAAPRRTRATASRVQTANLCTPGTNVVMDGKLHTEHCINSTSKTYDGDQWVRVEAIVHGDELIQHFVEGEMVLEYTKPQIGGGAVEPVDPKIKVDGTPLTGATSRSRQKRRPSTSGRSSSSISKAAWTRRPPTTRATS